MMIIVVMVVCVFQARAPLRRESSRRERGTSDVHEDVAGGSGRGAEQRHRRRRAQDVAAGGGHDGRDRDQARAARRHPRRPAERGPRQQGSGGDQRVGDADVSAREQVAAAGEAVHRDGDASADRTETGREAARAAVVEGGHPAPAAPTPPRAGRRHDERTSGAATPQLRVGLGGMGGRPADDPSSSRRLAGALVARQTAGDRVAVGPDGAVVAAGTPLAHLQRVGDDGRRAAATRSKVRADGGLPERPLRHETAALRVQRGATPVHDAADHVHVWR